MREIYALTIMVQTTDAQTWPEILCESKMVAGPVDYDADGNLVQTQVPEYTLAYRCSFTELGETGSGALFRIYAQDEVWPELVGRTGYLAGSIEELSLLHPEIAKHTFDIVYLRDGERRTQISAAEYTAELGPVVELRVRYSTVGAYRRPDLSPKVQILSEIDQGLIAGKDAVKGWALGWIKGNPTCTMAELVAAVDAEFDEYDAGLSKKLVRLYIDGAATAGYIESADFKAFRDWVVATPVEELMRI